MPPDLPLTLAEWPRNGRETVRVRLDRYNGHAVVDCRCWWSAMPQANSSPAGVV